jgi:hypothetical protein
MPWYTGRSLLEVLEWLPSALDTRSSAFRFPVQRVLRPDHTFRGFSGQIASGTIRPGDAIAVLPSGRTAVVERIVTFDGDLTEAHAPLSVTLVLSHELDISRGDLIVSAHAPATVARNIKAALVWMDQRPLERNRRYLLKHTSQTVPAFVSSVDHRTDIGTLAHELAESLEMNAIGAVTLNLLRPIAIDRYSENRSTGAFILIDPESNATVAVGMITSASSSTTIGEHISASASGPVTASERASRWGHRGGILELSGPRKLIDQIERSLFLLGAATVRIDTGDDLFRTHPGLLEHILRLKTQSGLLALVAASSDSVRLIARAGDQQLNLNVNNPEETIRAIHRLLARARILLSPGKADAQ